MDQRIRMATAADVAEILRIYAPFVRDTAVTFELETPSVAAMTARIAETQRQYPWLVFQRDAAIAGYAYATAFRARRAYDWSAEVSVYVSEGHRRLGVASALYASLFALLRLQGVVRLIAGIALPNPESVALHERLGFLPAGRFSRVGFKHGRWHDVGFWERALADPSEAPLRQTPPELAADPRWAAGLVTGLRRRSD